MEATIAMLWCVQWVSSMFGKWRTYCVVMRFFYFFNFSVYMAYITSFKCMHCIGFVMF